MSTTPPARRPASSMPLPEPGALIALNRLCRRFLLVSLVYLALGIAGGLMLNMGMRPMTIFSHVHTVLIGFVVFLIYGVGYKLIPTMFAAKHSIPSQKLADAHFWVANAGLVLMVGADFLRPALGGSTLHVIALGGTLQALGAGFFIYQMAIMFK